MSGGGPSRRAPQPEGSRGRLSPRRYGLLAKGRQEAELRRALGESDELAVYYQPIVDLRDREMLGVEALLRWEHPELGPIPPRDVIPLAEEVGLIGAVGEVVLTEATTSAARWRQAGGAVALHVNLSASELIDPAVRPNVAAALAESGLPASLLHLEVTETAILEEPRLALENLEALRRLGVHLSLDDLRAGPSSLRRITDLAPIAQVKIDRSLVARIAGRREGRIVASLTALCSDLGLDVVAEGVETEEEATELVALGVHRGQGFLFARPAPPEVIEASLGITIDG